MFSSLGPPLLVVGRAPDKGDQKQDHQALAGTTIGPKAISSPGVETGTCHSLKGPLEGGEDPRKGTGEVLLAWSIPRG